MRNILKKPINRIITIGMIIIMLLLMVLVNPISALENSQKKTVRVATAEFDKLITLNETKTEAVSGYAYEYINAIANYANWDIEYVVVDGFSEAVDKMKNGEADIAYDVSYTEERAKEMLFPKHPMGKDYLYLYALSSNDEIVVNDYSTIEGKSVGITKGTINDINLINWCKEKNVNLNFVYYDYIPDKEEALRNGDIDLDLEINMLVGQDYSAVEYISSNDYYLVANKNRPDLIEDINTAYTSIINLDLFYFSHLEEKYFSDTVASKFLSKNEENWLKKHDTLRLGYFNNYLPLSNKDNNGNPTGAMIDIIPEMMRLLAIDDRLDVEYICFDKAIDAYEALNNGEIDAVFPAYICDETKKDFNVVASNVFLTIDSDIVYHGEYNDDIYNKLAIDVNNINQYYLCKNYYPYAEFVYYNSLSECLDAVLHDEVSGVILNGLSSNILLSDNKYASLNVIKTLDNEELCFGVANDNVGLLTLLNRGISLIDNDFIYNSAYSYISSSYVYTFANFVQDNLMLIIAIIIILIAILLFFVIFTRRNNRKLMVAKDIIAKQKDELEMSLAVSNYFTGTFVSCYYVNLVDQSTFIYGRSKELEEKYPITEGFLKSITDYINKDIHPDDRAIITEAIQPENIKARLRKEPYYSLVVRDISGGKEKYYRFLVVRGTDEDHAAFGFMDITDEMVKNNEQQKILKQALDLSEEANRAKTSFLFNMSHDIRTPMNAITGFTAMAKRNIDNKDKVINYLDKIDIASQQLLALINQVLEMSRIESGKIAIQNKPIDLVERLNASEIIFKEVAASKEITYKTSLVNVEHPNVIFDVNRLDQVVLNIVSNAIKYTPSGGSVTLTCEEKPSNEEGSSIYTFTVEDTGIGMSEEYLGHIFDEFSRENSSTISGIQGTGLGMSIVKKIVDSLDGAIHIESKQNVGTKVSVSFKMPHGEKQETPSLSKKNDEVSLKGMRILLVEDNEMNKEIAVELLEEEGVIVETANDGVEALTKVKQSLPGHYDLILMDIQMPRMNGYEATKAIRKLENKELANIPIVAMTANAFAEDKHEAFESGMDAHIAKPFKIDILVDTINSFNQQGII